MRKSRLTILIFIIVLFSFIYSDSGGPDEFGYRWVDSDEPGGPVFDWIDITTDGTALSLYDDSYTTISLSGTFEFYGMAFDQLTVCSNGWVALGSWFTSTLSTTGFPNTSNPNSSIGLLWADLNPSSSPGRVYYKDYPDMFVVEYYQIEEFSSTALQTFEVILKYSTKEVLLQYLDVEPFSASYRTAHIGIEDNDGLVGLEVGTWTSSGGCLHDSLAIRFRATPSASPPYRNTFEDEPADFSVETGWEIGFLYPSSPAFPAHSGTDCMATVLGGDYENDADWTALSPHIITAGIEHPVVDFWQYYSMEEGHDGGVVEISTDEGETWNVYAPEDGYPVAMTAGPLAGESAFSGSSEGWQKVSFDLTPFAGTEIIMRFHFYSDGSNTDCGWYIDDFGYHQMYGVLEGNVDLAYFDPDSGALVEIVDCGRSTTTNVDGYFFFDSVSIGNHYLRVSRDHFVTRDSIAFSITRYDTTYLDILLAPELYSEDFEETNGDMVADPIDGWEWGVPTLGPETAHSGSLCWATKLDANYDNNADWKLTIQIPLYDVRWPLLSFYTWYQFYGEWVGMLYDAGNVKVSIDSGATWEVVYPVEGYDGIVGEHNDFLGGEDAFGGMESGDYWHQVNFPLYDFAGNPVIWVMFELGSDASHSARGWYIDDVVLAEDSSYAGIKEKTKLPSNLMLSLSPNPFNSSMRIEYSSLSYNKASQIEIYNISGKLLKTIPASDEPGIHTVVWHPDALPSGMYIIKLKSEKSSVIKTAVFLK